MLLIEKKIIENASIIFENSRFNQFNSLNEICSASLERTHAIALSSVSVCSGTHSNMLLVSGIGLETARDLASRGARVILGCRNMSRGIAACKDIIATTGSENLIVRRLDLSCMKTVRDFASDVIDSEDRLDVLVFL